jgi:hypothetical protein
MHRPLLGGQLGLAASIDRLRQLTESAVREEMAPAAALAAHHPFVVYDPTICGWYLLALEEVAVAFRRRGRQQTAAEFDRLADAVAADVERLLWWPEGRLFAAYDLVAERRLDGVGAMGLIAAASARACADGLTATVAAHHLGPAGPMRGRFGFAAGAVRPGGGVGSVVQWDGNAVWGATVYWAALVAHRAERPDVAADLRQQLVALIRRSGFREFYDAETGEPGGAGASSGFTWPALVLDMGGAT